jgi:hypothetical protein
MMEELKRIVASCRLRNASWDVDAGTYLSYLNKTLLQVTGYRLRVNHLRLTTRDLRKERTEG